MNEKAIDLNKAVDFSYPEGMEEAARCLDFLPDDGTRQNLLIALASLLTIM